jgi:hypothetical protein
MRPSFAFAALAIAAASAAHAQTSTQTGAITVVRTGWNSDSFGVMLNVPQINPANCQNGNIGYVSEASMPGYRTYYAALLAAYTARTLVAVVVHDRECVGPFPKIIGINLPR